MTSTTNKLAVVTVAYIVRNIYTH